METKLWKIIFTVSVAFSAAVLGSLTHAHSNSGDIVDTAQSADVQSVATDESEIVNTTDAVEKDLQYYIGISGLEDGIFVVTPKDGKLHFIRDTHDAKALQNLLNQIDRLQKDTCTTGCGKQHHLVQPVGSEKVRMAQPPSGGYAPPTKAKNENAPLQKEACAGSCGRGTK